MSPSEQPSASGDTQDPPLSKNKLKKLKRDQQWEENRAKRKAKRKEKIQEKKQKKRVAQAEAHAAASVQSETMPSMVGLTNDRSSKKPRRPQFTRLPITFVLDCGFDDLMMDKERKSLASQITRCYSDNHKAPYQANLAISSFEGHLKERFDGLLAGNYQSWKNVRFLEDNFVDAAAQAKQWMKANQGVRLAGIFANRGPPEQAENYQNQEGEVVYLSSDSPDTLTELRPYSTYIIGGLVDRNRHKGICYKRAMDRGMKTAKLPIGDFMQMTSRFVLATNHISEIMLRWLEHGDWGKAFLQVVPKRKGGTLKDGPDVLDDDHDGDTLKKADDGVGVSEELSSDANHGIAVQNDAIPDPESALVQEGREIQEGGKEVNNDINGEDGHNDTRTTPTSESRSGEAQI